MGRQTLQYWELSSRPEGGKRREARGATTSAQPARAPSKVSEGRTFWVGFEARVGVPQRRPGHYNAQGSIKHLLCASSRTLPLYRLCRGSLIPSFLGRTRLAQTCPFWFFLVLSPRFLCFFNISVFGPDLREEKRVLGGGGHLTDPVLSLGTDPYSRQTPAWLASGVRRPPPAPLPGSRPFVRRSPAFTGRGGRSPGA